MIRSVVFSPAADTDLKDLYLFIAERDGDNRALAYIERIEHYCQSLTIFPNRGMVREDLGEGMRLTVFQRRATIAYHIEGNTIIIDRVLYGGRTIEVPANDSEEDYQ